MFVCEFIYTDKKKNRISVLNWYLLKHVFKPSSECILSLLIPVPLVSWTKINPICRSDLTLSRYTPWYTLRSSVFFLSTSGFSDYSFFVLIFSAF